jgi:hypothetical protein
MDPHGSCRKVFVTGLSRHGLLEGFPAGDESPLRPPLFDDGSADRLYESRLGEQYGACSFIITPASKHVKGCHTGLDPASTPVMDSRFRGKDRIGIYCCRSNNGSDI